MITPEPVTAGKCGKECSDCLRLSHMIGLWCWGRANFMERGGETPLKVYYGVLAAVTEIVNLTFTSILLTRILSHGVSVRVSVGNKGHISGVELRDMGSY